MTAKARLRTFEPGLHESIRYCPFSHESLRSSGLEAVRARVKREVPPAFTEKDIQAAKAMLADPDITIEEVAGRLKVAASTLYRHLPGD